MHSTWTVEKANLKKFSLDQDQICLFNCSSWKHLKTASPLWPHLLHQVVHTWFISYVSIFKKTEFSLAIGTVSSSEVQMSERVWAEVNCSFNRRDSLELLHCLILHYCIVHLVLLNFFCWLSFISYSFQLQNSIVSNVLIFLVTATNQYICRNNCRQETLEPKKEEFNK